MIQGTQFSVVLKNIPGELSRLCDHLKREGINILGMSIQNAEYNIMELYKLRGRTGNRIAPTASYGSILKELEDYSIIRLIVDRTEEAISLLTKAGYMFETDEVLLVTLENKPGMLGEIARKCGEGNINIDYVYGSARADTEKAMFILNVQDIQKALKALSR